MSRAIFLAFILAVLPLPAPAEVAPAPVMPEVPGLTGKDRLRAELTQPQAAPTQERLKFETFEKPLAAAVSNPETPVAEVSLPLTPSPCAESAAFAYGWLALSFAMLILGFVAGIVWLRERNRKKLGGMYLRI